MPSLAALALSRAQVATPDLVSPLTVAPELSSRPVISSFQVGVSAALPGWAFQVATSRYSRRNTVRLSSEPMFWLLSMKAEAWLKLSALAGVKVS